MFRVELRLGWALLVRSRSHRPRTRIVSDGQVQDDPKLRTNVELNWAQFAYFNVFSPSTYFVDR